VGLLACSAGCGPDNGLTLGRVQGKVTYKGEPIRYGTVQFEPDVLKDTHGPTAMGTITNDGTYIMSTEHPGDGVVVGAHKVSVIGLDPTPMNAATAPDLETGENFLKAKRRSARPSPRKTTVDTFTDRSGRVYRYLIPKELSSTETSGLRATVSRGSNSVNINVKEDGTAEITN
jgi:hypothetical protein